MQRMISLTQTRQILTTLGINMTEQDLAALLPPAPVAPRPVHDDFHPIRAEQYNVEERRDDGIRCQGVLTLHTMRAPQKQGGSGKYRGTFAYTARTPGQIEPTLGTLEVEVSGKQRERLQAGHFIGARTVAENVPIMLGLA